MLSQFHFCMDLRVKRDIRLVSLFLQYFTGQIGWGIQRYTDVYALINHTLTKQIITPSLHHFYWLFKAY